MTKQKTRSNLSVQYMTRIAILGALSAVLFPLEIPIVAFYKLDFSTLPALLGAFSMGPLPGLAILLIKDLSRLAYSSSMYVGELADFIMSAAFILPASLIYRKHKTRKTALVGMAVGTLCMIVVSVLVNWKMMIPFYMTAFNMDMEAIIGMAQKALPFVDTEWKVLLYVTAPFNLLKGFVLSLLTFVLYKRLSPLLHSLKARTTQSRKRVKGQRPLRLLIIGRNITMRTHSPNETRELAKRLAKELRRGDMLLLWGDLGAGKSEFTRGLAQGLGVTATVTSPSFTILNVYDDGRIPLYHFDWYRLNSVEELYEMGMEEFLGGDGVAVVEWPSQCPEAIPETHLAIRLTPVDETTRDVTITPMGGFREISLEEEQ